MRSSSLAAHPAVTATAPRPAAPGASRVPLPLGRHGDGLPRGERHLLIAGVAGVHVLALWGLLQVESVRSAVREVSPLIVDFIVDAPPQPAPPPPAPARAPSPAPRPAPKPVITAATTPEPAPAPFVVPAPAPLPEPVAAQAPPAPAPAPMPAPPAPAPGPPGPRLLPATAVRYVVPPPIEVPLASRRLGESGTVLLRVIVDPEGLPRQVNLHKSSGHARLDEQAMRAVRQARFKPQTENGLAIEWIVIAPLTYEIE